MSQAFSGVGCGHFRVGHRRQWREVGQGSEEVWVWMTETGSSTTEVESEASFSWGRGVDRDGNVVPGFVITPHRDGEFYIRTDHLRDSLDAGDLRGARDVQDRRTRRVDRNVGG